MAAPVKRGKDCGVFQKLAGDLVVYGMTRYGGFNYW